MLYFCNLYVQNYFLLIFILGFIFSIIKVNRQYVLDFSIIVISKLFLCFQLCYGVDSKEFCFGNSRLLFYTILSLVLLSKFL